MEKSTDDSPEKHVERVRDDGITNDKEEETHSKDEPILVGSSDDSNSERTSQPVEDDATRGSNGEGLCSLSPDEIKHIVANLLATMSAESSKGPSDEFRSSSDNIFRTSYEKEPAYNGINKIVPGESSKQKSQLSRFSSSKRKNDSLMSKSRSSRSNSRNNKRLQSRGGTGVPESIAGAEMSNAVAQASCSKERRRKKKKTSRENSTDVFRKMRNHVRYILNKIKYEQSLIDAYGGEGWKGMSIDKLKPEKELQRASSEIIRCKLRLRDLFQRLDAICADGAYPKSMFDSEELLDSEDIYCTICGSKEISTDNDIVLCDGECNRAFHQLCLKPPLLTEEIPPEDLGWLCPGCDCKFDCTELLNDFFGSDLSMKNNWTSIFPEAAAAAVGSNIIDEILRLPSDDSEDDDFIPDNMDVDCKDRAREGGEAFEGEESASDDSDFSSASEELADFINKVPLVEKFPYNVEDEEDDDDYDPEAPDPDNIDGKKVEGEKSNEGDGSASDESDFSSASEDLGDFLYRQLVGNNPDNSEDENEDSNPDDQEPDQQNYINAEWDTVTSPINENFEFIAAEPDQDSRVPGSKKRDIERLDYKKLFDETYGNVLSDSSDDEEWSESEVGPSRKRHDSTQSGSYTTLKSKKRGSRDGEQPMDRETKPQEAKNGTFRRSGKKLKSSSENGSTVKGSRSTLGDTATQKLTEAFQNNHYPERAVKEGLAKDLGLSYQKVDKWFGKARWSFNHPLHARSVSKNNLATKSPPQTKSGSQAEVAIVNNSSKNHSSQDRPEAKTTVSDTSIKIASPPNPTSVKSEGKRGPSKKLTSLNSSTTDITNQGDASNIASQPIIRQSNRLHKSHTSNGSGDNDATKGSKYNGESCTKKGNSSTPNTKQRKKRAPPNAKKA